MIQRRTLTRIVPIVLFSAACLAAKQNHETGETRAKQPPPPQSGPGSNALPHRSVKKTLIGQGENGYWVFEPADPTPPEAPVVFFLHGGRGMNPRDYGGWIDHLARRGNIVVYPVFEKADFAASQKDSNEVLIRRCFDACKRAVDWMKSSGTVKPRLDRVAVTGHSFGAGLTPIFAAQAARIGLPVPKAIMTVEGGWKGKEEYPAEQLKDIAASTLALIVIGEDDQFGESRKGDLVFKSMTQVPQSHKRYVLMHSDDHGTPPLVADHSVPLSARDDYGTKLSEQQVKKRKFVNMFSGMVEGVVDTFDTNGLWKIFDTLMDAAFAGKDITAVTPGDTYPLGTWSDGTPVKPMTVTANP